MKKKQRLPIYGVMAEFHTPNELVEATRRVRNEGYTRFDAFAPFPIEPLDDLVPERGPYLPLLVLIGGITGAVAGYALQFYIATIYYPMNIGGRPYHSWVSFIPVTFELMILFAALTTVFGMLGLNGLPMPYHPVFNVKRFAFASNDRFFICIEAEDPKFDPERTKKLLEGMNPEIVAEVQH